MIERMEDLVLTGMGVPFTPFTVVNGDKLVPLLDRIRESMPDEIVQAHRVIERRDEILTTAQQKANETLQEAKRQSEFMLSESELLRAVHEEANRVRQQITQELEAMRKKAFEETEANKAQAYEEARRIREGADQYAESILGSLDKSLAEFQSAVKNGQKYLRQARAEAQRSAVASQAPQSKPAVMQEPTVPAYGSQPAREEASTQGSSYAQDFLRQTTLHQ